MMKNRLYYSIALSFLSLFASSLLSNYFRLTIPAFFLGMSIWFCAVGVGSIGNEIKCKNAIKNLKNYCLVIAFCMNSAFAVTIPFFYDYVQFGALVYVDYWTCLLYGLIISAVGIIITTIVLLIKNKKAKKIEKERTKKTS